MNTSFMTKVHGQGVLKRKKSLTPSICGPNLGLLEVSKRSDSVSKIPRIEIPSEEIFMVRGLTVKC